MFFNDKLQAKFLFVRNALHIIPIECILNAFMENANMFSYGRVLKK